MTTEKIYGPWIKWDGGECPVPPDTRVQAKIRSGGVLGPRCASTYRWAHLDSNSDIVEYHTVTEQPDLKAAEQLLRANGYTITPPPKPLTFEDVVPMTEAPPKGTEYWVVDATAREGVSCACSLNDVGDYSRNKNMMAYLDKEHAVVAARHLFSLKGGEV